MEKKIDELVNRYSEHADIILGFMQSIVSKISDGKVPDSGSSETYAALLSQLEESYGAVEEYASQILKAEEMPEKGSSVSAFRDAVLECEALQLQENVKKYVNTLKAFLNVTSNSEAFADVLEPFQMDTQRLIEQIEGDEFFYSDNADRLTHELEGPECFLQALTFPDFDTEESMCVLEKVFENYPSRKIQMGISTGKYYLKTPIEETEPVAPVEMIEADPVEQINSFWQEDNLVMAEPEMSAEPVVDEFVVPEEAVEEVVANDANTSVDETVLESEDVSDEDVVDEMSAPMDMDAPADMDAPVDMDAPADMEVPANMEVPVDMDVPVDAVNEEPMTYEEALLYDEPTIIVKKPTIMPASEPEVAKEEATVEMPRFCIHCGTKIEPKYKFCIGCGRPVSDSVNAGIAADEEEMIGDAPEEEVKDSYVSAEDMREDSAEHTMPEADHSGPEYSDRDYSEADYSEDNYSEGNQEESAFIQDKNDYFHMNEFILDEKVTSAYFENSYKIYDMYGNVVGAARQENISGSAKASRFLFGKGTTQLQKFDLVLLDANGGKVGEIARDGGALADINIDDANGRRLLSTKLRLGAMKDASDNVICKFGVAGLTKRTLKDANGNLLAEIDHKWNGIKSIFTTADKYYVRISPDLTGELRQIIVSAAIAYDLLSGEH